MVLPWISDNRSLALRNGLLGCPYFDSDSGDILFAYDNRRSNRLKQSVFFNLKSPVIENNSSSNFGHETDKQLSVFRAAFPETYVPTSSVGSCMTKCENMSNFNKLNLRPNPNINGQYFAIYPQIERNSITIDYVNEIELSSRQSALNIFERQELYFPFIVNDIRSYDGRSFAVLSSQTIKLFKSVENCFCDVFECIAPDDDYFTSMDVSRYDFETSSILKNSRKLILQGSNYKYESIVSDDFINCNYSAHPSLLFLSGFSGQIELKDRRSAFPNLIISDQIVPFRNVSALIAHETDENLVALSCKNNTSPGYNSYCPLFELRVYDIRYPKESVVRIASNSAVSEFIRYSSYIDEKSDNLIGLDNSSNLYRWEFGHSKSNTLYMDGILSLTDAVKLSTSKSNLNSENVEYIGHSVAQSSLDRSKMFLARLTIDGEIDYCTISSSEDYLDSDPNEFNQNFGDIVDYSSLKDDYVSRHELKLIEVKELQESFAPVLQSTFHIDFYWDEIKSKLCRE